MKRYFIHPVKPLGGNLVPYTELIAAVVNCDDTGGQMTILVPTFKERLEGLFETPVTDLQGRTWPPWTPQALEFILESGISRIGMAAIECQP